MESKYLYMAWAGYEMSLLGKSIIHIHHNSNLSNI